MKDPITLERSALLSLLSYLMPNPEDPDSPVGPRTHGLAHFRLGHEAVFLNPQPLPPRAIAEVRAAVQMLETGLRQADMLGQGTQALERARGQFKTMLTGWCGNEPRPLPFPLPDPGPDPDPQPWWRAVGQLQQAVQLGKLARFDSPLRDDYQRGAAQLLDAALSSPR